MENILKNILENIKSILLLTGSNVLLPIIVSIITTIITNKINDVRKKKEELPRFLLKSPCMGAAITPNNYNEKMTQLNGYYRLQRKLDSDLLDFLNSNGFDIKLTKQHIMKEIVRAYKNEKYTKNTNFQNEKEINEAIVNFKENPQFIEMIKVYEEYEKYSKWIFTIENVGNSTAYNFEVDHFKESDSEGFLFYCEDLECNAKRKIVIYYFDGAITIDNKNFLCIRKNNMITKFYLVDNKKYNKKDEILFTIKYKDKYNKSYEQYCCARIAKKGNLNLMGLQ